MIGKICPHLIVEVKAMPVVGLQIDESYPMFGSIAQLSREAALMPEKSLMTKRLVLAKTG